MNVETQRLALFLPSLRGGGAERVMVNLARGFIERGIAVDLVLAKAEGTYLSEVPQEVRIIDLKSRRVLTSLPGLIRYLRREKPSVLLSAMDHTNIIALWARKIAGLPCRLAISVHSTLSKSSGNAVSFRGRLMPCLISRFYHWADVIIAVSQGVADDLVKTINLPKDLVKIIYNPVISSEILEKARESLDHPWFALGQPPVILSVGRLTAAKDYPTLIRAFAFVRTKRPARLMILGEGKDRPKLEALLRELGLEEDVSLPGFVDNPYAYMARAALFVLSSIWEGLPTVLIEAMALGTPIVSTDCPSGPREIAALTKGCFLVPCGNPLAIGNAIIKVIDKPHRMVYSGLELFTVDYSANMYEEVLFTS